MSANARAGALAATAALMGGAFMGSTLVTPLYELFAARFGRAGCCRVVLVVT